MGAIVMKDRVPKVILVIDDNPDIREILKIALETLGYTTYCAEDGQEGIDLLFKIERPDLIICDWMMPKMGGEEFLALLRKHPQFKKIPVVVCTGSFKDASALPAPVSGFLSKPFSMLNLIEVIKQLIH
jgi:two-component system, chemotaxis family, response regulator PixH